MLKIMLLGKTGSNILPTGYDDLRNNQNVITSLKNGFNLCYFNAMVVQQSTNTMNVIKPQTITANAKRLFYEFYEIPDGTNKKSRKTYRNEALFAYEGILEPRELKQLCKFTKKNLNIYISDPIYTKVTRRTYSLHQQIMVDKTYDTVSVLRIQQDHMFHVFPITNADEDATCASRNCCRLRQTTRPTSRSAALK